MRAKDYDYSLLSFVVGEQVGEKVPYYRGLPSDISWGELKDLGAASAASGAVGLFHVKEVTTEAKEKGEGLLKDGYKTIVVTDEDLARVKKVGN